jgi:hypothetical protein
MFKKPKQIEINKSEDSNNGVILKNNFMIERPINGMSASYNIKTMEFPIFNINSCKFHINEKSNKIYLQNDLSLEMGDSLILTLITDIILKEKNIKYNLSGIANNNNHYHASLLFICDSGIKVFNTVLTVNKYNGFLEFVIALENINEDLCNIKQIHYTMNVCANIELLHITCDVSVCKYIDIYSNLKIIAHS